MLPIADKDLEIVIHACPTQGSPKTWDDGREGLGSAAVWINFLKNSTMAQDYTNVLDLDGKILVSVHFGTPFNNELGIPVNEITGVTMELMEEEFGVVGYYSAWNVFSMEVPGF